MSMFDIEGLGEVETFNFGHEKATAVTQDAKITQKVVEERAMKRRIRNEEIHTLAAKRLDQLCVRPLPGEQWRIVTEKAFNAYAFICSLLQEGGIEDLHLAIYRINEPTVESLIEMIEDGRIIAGNKSQKAAMAAGIRKVRVIETQGDELIAVKRTDLSLDSKEGRELAYADNLTTQVNLATLAA